MPTQQNSDGSSVKFANSLTLTSSSTVIGACTTTGTNNIIYNTDTTTTAPCVYDRVYTTTTDRVPIEYYHSVPQPGNEGAFHKQYLLSFNKECKKWTFSFYDKKQTNVYKEYCVISMNSVINDDGESIMKLELHKDIDDLHEEMKNRKCSRRIISEKNITNGNKRARRYAFFALPSNNVYNQTNGYVYNGLNNNVITAGAISNYNNYNNFTVNGNYNVIYGYNNNFLAGNVPVINITTPSATAISNTISVSNYAASQPLTRLA